MVEIPESHRRLLEDKVFAMLGTVMPDGQPQVHPVWVDYDGQYVRVNTARGRQKDENLQRHPQATVLLIDTRSPYFWMEIRGRVVERIEGKRRRRTSTPCRTNTRAGDYANRRPGTVRVLYKIEPTRVLASG